MSEFLVIFAVLLTLKLCSFIDLSWWIIAAPLVPAIYLSKWVDL
jgi:hypothetical protein